MKRMIKASGSIEPTNFINTGNGFPSDYENVCIDHGNFQIVWNIYYPGYGDISVSVAVDEEKQMEDTNCAYEFTMVPSESGNYNDKSVISEIEFRTRVSQYINKIFEKISNYLGMPISDFEKDISQIVSALCKEYSFLLEEEY